MTDFIRSQGNVFLAHRLRRASDRIVEEVGEVLTTLDLDVPPRGASMLLLIDAHPGIGVVEIARRLRQSHPLIVRMAQAFEALGLVTIASDPEDARRRVLMPTAKAHAQAAAIQAFNTRLSAMFDELFAEIKCPLTAVLDRLDAALDARPIGERLFTHSPTDGACQ